jgi:GNAT superfamily N-acetyltransferase
MWLGEPHFPEKEKKYHATAGELRHYREQTSGLNANRVTRVNYEASREISMALSVRRLGPGDAALLAQLAAEDADFDLAGRGTAQNIPTPEEAQRYLANPAVLCWAAFADTTLVGSLDCFLLPMATGDGAQVLLYDIGVHTRWRRRGVGRALLAEMERWMRAHNVREVWVLADNPEAVQFYRACGFAPEAAQPVYLTRSLAPPG